MLADACDDPKSGLWCGISASAFALLHSRLFIALILLLVVVLLSLLLRLHVLLHLLGVGIHANLLPQTRLVQWFQISDAVLQEECV